MLKGATCFGRTEPSSYSKYIVSNPKSGCLCSVCLNNYKLTGMLLVGEYYELQVRILSNMKEIKK